MLPEEFPAVYEMLERAFPVDERRPYQAQKKINADDHQKTYVYKEEGELCAVLSCWELESFCYIEHLVVSERLRNRGLGQKILTEYRDRCDKRLVFEVEPPTTEMRRRRIAFYERNGFFQNPYPYTLPPQGEGREPVDLIIMSDGRALTRAEYLRFYVEVYQTVFRREPPQAIRAEFEKYSK